jgi:RNA polymerase sigma-70 factor (ECF subfamily)
MERDEILARLRERIVAFAASRIQRDLAEDLAQEVLIVLEQKYAHIVALDDLVPLSLQILRYKMASFRRKSQRRGEAGSVQIDDLQLADAGTSPESYAEGQEMLRRLSHAIPKLEERCREIFRMKLLGKTFAEIQEALGAASINTVYTWDARCRARLLDLLGGRWEK